MESRTCQSRLDPDQRTATRRSSRARSICLRTVDSAIPSDRAASLVDRPTTGPTTVRNAAAKDSRATAQPTFHVDREADIASSGDFLPTLLNRTPVRFYRRPMATKTQRTTRRQTIVLLPPESDAGLTREEALALFDDLETAGQRIVELERAELDAAARRHPSGSQLHLYTDDRDTGDPFP
jgi:hypothetical protein